MAWESKEQRAETISWNGKKLVPRMFWENVTHNDSILAANEPRSLEQRALDKKFYWHRINKDSGTIEHNGELYMKLTPTTNKDDIQLYRPHIKSDNLDVARAVSYVQWFNEKSRQLTALKLLNNNKKALIT